MFKNRFNNLTIINIENGINKKVDREQINSFEKKIDILF